MPKTSKRKPHDGRKSRSSSSGSRDKKRSVFDRLGRKALPLEPSLCRHDLQYGSCPNCSISTFSAHLLLNSLKKNLKEKETKKGEEVLDWSKWDSSELECEDEKSLERRRRLLKQELGLHMISDSSKGKEKTSSCSSSSSSSTRSSSSSLSGQSRSSSPDIPSIRRSVTEDSASYKSGKYNSPSNKLFKKKSVSPVFLRNPSPPKESRKKNMGRTKGHDDEEERSASRERRRDERHRRERSSASAVAALAAAHHQNPFASLSSRKKDEERSSRRDESRRERKSASRSDSRSCQYEETSRTGSSRYSERGCRERGRDRDRHRESSKASSSRSSDGSRRRIDKEHYSRSCHDSKHYQQLSPSHHHYRSERSSRYGSSERERLTLCKELSPRESDSRVRINSSSYSDSRSGRRRGWESSRYDSPKSSRDWEQSSQSERQTETREWEKRSKQTDEKEFSSSDKEKDSDWKSREREEDGSSSAKRPRVEEPLPISEQLSDISDGPDDILNRDDVDDGLPGDTECQESTQKKEDTSSLTPNIDHSLIDQKIRGEDSLSEISDEDLQLEEESKSKGDTLGVDWGSLVAECQQIRKCTEEERSTCSRAWDADSIFQRIGVCPSFASDELFKEIDSSLQKNGCDGLLIDIGGIRRSKVEIKKSSMELFCQQTALSARMDLMLRRQLCSLPILNLETRTIYQFQAI